MTVGVLLILYGLILIGVGVGVRWATWKVGDPQWPWWVLSLAVVGIAWDPIASGVAALGGADPGTSLPRVAGRLVFGGGLLVGVGGLIRFMKIWHEDRERRFMESIWSTMAEVYLLEPSTGVVLDSNRAGSGGFATAGSESFGERIISGQEAFRSALERVSEPGSGRERVQLDLRMSDGRVGPASLSMERTDAPGQPAIALFVQDLTEIRRMELQARTQADTHRLLIESVAEAILVVDPEAIIRYGSPSVLDFLGRDPVGEPVLGLLPESEAAGAMETIRRIVRDPEASMEGRVGTRALAGGGPYDIEYRLRHVDYPGVGPSVLVSALDISDRVGTERRIRARRTVVADLIRMPVVAEGRVEEVASRVAQAACDLLPGDRASVWLIDDEVGGLRPIVSHSTDPATGLGGDGVLAREEAAAWFEALLPDRTVEIFEVEADDRVAPIREALRRRGTGALIAAPVRVAGELRGVLTCEHRGGSREWTAEESVFVTELAEVLLQALQAAERRRVDLERQDMAAQLRMSQRMETVGVLAGGIAHDFNNLLTPILGYAELLQVEARERGDDTASVQEIVVACQRAAGLVNQLLTFSRNLERQDPEVIQVEKIVEEVGGLIRASLPASIRVDMRLPEQLPPVEADATQLHQVVLNLATNAWQAMAGAGGVLTISLADVTLDADSVSRMPGLAEGRHLLLQVADTGTGMDPDLAQRIFEPFFTTKPVGEGTGLGLAVTHGIVTGHGGHIEVETAPGEGTCFSVWLPASTAGIGAAAEDVAEPAGGGRIDVVVVDDEPPVMRFVVRVLQREGWAVEGFAGPTEAFAAIEERVARGAIPDVVVTDQTMPETSGLELVEKIHEIAPSLPVVLMSGFDAMLTPEGLEAAGIAAFLRKPFVARQLVAAVHEALPELEAPRAAPPPRSSVEG